MIVAKWTVLCSFLCFQDDLLFAFYIGHLPSWQFFELLPFFIHRCICIRDFHRVEHGNELVHKIFMTQRVELLFQQCDLRDLWVESFPNAFSSTCELLRCMHAWIFGCWIRHNLFWYVFT